MKIKPAKAPSLMELVRDESIRTMAFVTLATSLVSFGALFLFKGVLAAAVPTAFAAIAFFLRAFWPLVPYLVALAYLMVMPDATPAFLSSPSSFMVRQGPFTFADILLVPCILASFISLCRFLGLTKQALPFEPETSYSKEYGAVRRPGVLVTDRELKRLGISLVVVTILGQLMWYLLTRLQFDFLHWFPLTFLPKFGAPTGVSYPEPLARFLLLALAGGGLALTLRLISWYWGLMQVNLDEARAIVTDSAWYESRRELCALEKKRSETIADAERKAMFRHPKDQP